MIATQYRFPLPADYDMAIIDRRIADRGHLTDDRFRYKKQNRGLM